MRNIISTVTSTEFLVHKCLCRNIPARNRPNSCRKFRAHSLHNPACNLMQDYVDQFSYGVLQTKLFVPTKASSLVSIHEVHDGKVGQPKLTPKNCLEIQQTVENPPEINTIYPFGPQGAGLSVRCDFQTDGGGWTIIQTRSSGGLLDFYKNWEEYENGFGSASTNYWIGLKAIYALTSGGPADQSLKVDLGDWEGNFAYADYQKFAVSDASDFYRLAVAGYSGNAGDSLLLADIGIANNMQFSTWDNDHDKTPSENCAEYWQGAWWFNSCYDAHLNGRYYQGSQGDTWGMAWESWKGYYSLRTASMKIRDANFRPN